jgi:hypothetical protein
MLVAVVACGLISTAPAFAADRDLDVRVDVVGEEIRSYVSLFVRAPLQRVWDVITDFERAPTYTRDLRVSKVLSRSGDTLRLLQKAQVRFGPFTFPIEMLRDIRLVAPLRTEAHLVSGTMKKYDSTTELVAEAGGTRVIVRSRAIPGSALAMLAGESFVKRETEEKFRELQAEILRREHVAARQ